MKLKLLLPLLLCATLSNAQVIISNQSLTDSTLPIIYAGVDNHIRFDNGPGRTLIVSINRGTIHLIKPSLYNVKVNEGDSLVMTYYDGHRLLGTKVFAIQKLPAPVGRIGNINNGFVVTKRQLLNNPIINIDLPGCFYKHALRPLSYRVMIYKKNLPDEIFYAKTNLSDKLLDEQKELIKESEPGDLIVLDNFRTNSSNGFDGALTAVIIKIK